MPAEFSASFAFKSADSNPALVYSLSECVALVSEHMFFEEIAHARERVYMAWYQGAW